LPLVPVSKRLWKGGEGSGGSQRTPGSSFGIKVPLNVFRIKEEAVILGCFRIFIIGKPWPACPRTTTLIWVELSKVLKTVISLSPLLHE